MLKNIINKIKYLLSKVKKFFEIKHSNNPYLEYIKNYIIRDLKIATELLILEWNRSKPEWKKLLKWLKISFNRFLSLTWRGRLRFFVFYYYRKRWEIYIFLSSSEGRKKILKNLKILGRLLWFLLYSFYLCGLLYIAIFKLDEICQYPTIRERLVYIISFFTKVIYTEFPNYLARVKKNWYKGYMKWPTTLGFLIWIVIPYYEAKMTLKWKFIGFCVIILYIYLLTLSG